MVGSLGPRRMHVRAEKDDREGPGRMQREGCLGCGKSSKDMNGNLEDSHFLLSHLSWAWVAGAPGRGLAGSSCAFVPRTAAAISPPSMDSILSLRYYKQCSQPATEKSVTAARWF